MGHLGLILFWGFLAAVVITVVISLSQEFDFDESLTTFYWVLGVGLVGLCVYLFVLHWKIILITSAIIAGIVLLGFLLWKLVPWVFRLVADWIERRRQEKLREEERIRREAELKQERIGAEALIENMIKDYENYMNAILPKSETMQSNLASVDSEQAGKWMSLQKRTSELLEMSRDDQKGL